MATASAGAIIAPAFLRRRVKTKFGAVSPRMGAPARSETEICRMTSVPRRPIETPHARAVRRRPPGEAARGSVDAHVREDILRIPHLDVVGAGGDVRRVRG